MWKWQETQKFVISPWMVTNLRLLPFSPLLVAVGRETLKSKLPWKGARYRISRQLKLFTEVKFASCRQTQASRHSRLRLHLRWTRFPCLSESEWTQRRRCFIDSSLSCGLQHCCTSSGAAGVQGGINFSQPPPIGSLITAIIKAWPNSEEISSRRFARSKHRVLTAPPFWGGFFSNVNLKFGCRKNRLRWDARRPRVVVPWVPCMVVQSRSTSIVHVRDTRTSVKPEVVMPSPESWRPKLDLGQKTLMAVPSSEFILVPSRHTRASTCEPEIELLVYSQFDLVG